MDRGENDTDTIVMTAPVRDFFGDLNGWIVVAISPDAVPRLLAEVNGAAGTLVPVVADASRRLVLSLPRADLDAARQVVLAPVAAPGALERIERPGRTGSRVVLAVRTAAAAEAPGWSTLMLVDEREANGRLDRLRAVLGVVFALVMVAACFAAVVSLRQAAKPLADVATSMVRVAGGDLSTRLRVEYSGELGTLVTSFNTMVEEVQRSQEALQRTEALRREVEIAHQIQTAILPVSPAVKGFEVAARMQPADDVGGDLYDILSFGDTAWVLVGDVSGHGINSGLVMMMAQAAAYGAIADDPHCSPGAVISAVNRVVHENVRRRMRRDDYMTLMAARYLGDGRFVAAGAHQPIFLARADGRVDVVESSGPWIGLSATVEPPPMEEYEFRLAPGELVCFVTDGILEAKDGEGVLFGEERLKQLLAAGGLLSASQALATLFEAVEKFSPEPADDMTAVVLRRKNDPAEDRGGAAAPIQLFIRMNPPWVFIDELRRFVESFCACASLGPDREAQVALTVHELMQNAVPHARGRGRRARPRGRPHAGARHGPRDERLPRGGVPRAARPGGRDVPRARRAPALPVPDEGTSVDGARGARARARPLRGADGHPHPPQVGGPHHRGGRGSAPGLEAPCRWRNPWLARRSPPECPRSRSRRRSTPRTWRRIRSGSGSTSRGPSAR